MRKIVLGWECGIPVKLFYTVAVDGKMLYNTIIWVIKTGAIADKQSILPDKRIFHDREEQ
jgi:hypothetical protein